MFVIDGAKHHDRLTPRIEGQRQTATLAGIVLRNGLTRKRSPRIVGPSVRERGPRLGSALLAGKRHGAFIEPGGEQTAVRSEGEHRKALAGRIRGQGPRSAEARSILRPNRCRSRYPDLRVISLVLEHTVSHDRATLRVDRELRLGVGANVDEIAVPADDRRIGKGAAQVGGARHRHGPAGHPRYPQIIMRIEGRGYGGGALEIRARTVPGLR